MKFIVSFLAAALVLPLLAGAARADIDVPILNADKIKGTVSDPAEVETFRIDLPAESQFTVKAKGQRGFRPAVRVFAPNGEELFVGDIVEKGAAVALKNAATPQTGEWRVEVRSRDGGTGDYALKVSWKYAKKKVVELDLSAGPRGFNVHAVPGSLLTVKVVALRGSPAIPAIDAFEGPDGALPLPAKAASTGFKKTPLLTLGRYSAAVRDDSGGGGSVRVTAKLKAPKPSKRKFDLRSKVIGSATGEEFAIAAVIGADGGTVGVPLPPVGEDPVSEIAGSGVELPPGALPTASAIVVATSVDVVPKGDDGGAGPSVFFGPEGQRFATPVTVTVPVDVAQFEGDFTDLRVYTRDARGRVKLVPPPYQVDEVAGTCSFPASHFSSFRASKRGTGGSAAFEGAWLQVTQLIPDEDSYIVFNPDGSVDAVADGLIEEFCFRVEIVPAGTDPSLVFSIDGGRLRFNTPDSPEHVPTPLSNVPVDCDGL